MPIIKALKINKPFESKINDNFIKENITFEQLLNDFKLVKIINMFSNSKEEYENNIKLLLSKTPIATKLYKNGDVKTATVVAIIELKFKDLDKVKLINTLLYIIKMFNKYS